MRLQRGNSAKSRLTPAFDQRIQESQKNVAELEQPSKIKRTKEEIEAHKEYINSLAKPRNIAESTLKQAQETPK